MLQNKYLLGLLVCSGTECKVAVPPTQYAFHLDDQVIFTFKLFLAPSLLYYLLSITSYIKICSEHGYDWIDLYNNTCLLVYGVE